MLRKIEVIGYVVADATVYTPANGTRVSVNFKVAVNEKYKDANGQKVERAHFIDCSFWRAKADFAQYIKKGNLISVMGIPEAKVYQNKNGEHIPQLKIDVRDIDFLTSKESSNSTTQPPAFNNNDDDNSDIPF